MCTAVSFVTKDHYFGRNLDYEFSYEETVTVMPRNYKHVPEEIWETGMRWLAWLMWWTDTRCIMMR